MASASMPARMVSVSVTGAVGLALVYASAYFLPLLTATQAYFLTSMDLLRLVVWPSIFTIVVCAALVWVLSLVSQRWLSPTVATGFLVTMFSFITVIAFKGAAEAAGYHWQDTIPRGHDLHATQQNFRLGFSVLVLVIVWFQRRSLPRLCRVLSSLGFAFGALATLRLLMTWAGHFYETPVDGMLDSPMQIIRRQPPSLIQPESIPRRVVWIIFDETDYARVFGPDADVKTSLVNFNALQAKSVYATNATSPASATLYSIPALLTAVPIDGKGVQIDRSGVLSLQSTDGKLIPFNERNSVFGVLQSRGQTASILGFLHPYCKLFQLKRCDSYIWPETGSLGAAMLTNVPDTAADWMRRTDYWSNITRDSLSLLPEYLVRNDSLTFVHLNVPHLPAAYADAKARLSASPSPLTEYGRNLALTDEILGQIMQSVRADAGRHETLLVVSTDHWLRNRWYQANEIEKVRPVPLMMWRVGETAGIRLTKPISTVHTAEMILDFLQGKITDQQEIADWWRHQTTSAAYIAPST